VIETKTGKSTYSRPANRARGRYGLLASMVVAMFAVLALAACGGTTDNTPVPATSNSDLLKSAINNMKAAKSYHLDLSGTQAGQAITMTGDIDVANNAYKLDIAVAGQKVSAIQVMSQTYLSTDGGTTFALDPSNSMASFSSFTNMWGKADVSQIDAVKAGLKDGTPPDETIDGVNTHHLTADAATMRSLNPSTPTPAADPNAPTPVPDTGTADIWITKDANPTIRRMKLNMTSNGQAGNFLINWTNINQPVDIKAPPTK
jgi:hypothetical protein